MGDSGRLLVVNSRGGAAGLFAGGESTGTGPAGRLPVDGAHYQLNSEAFLRTAFSTTDEMEPSLR